MRKTKKWLSLLLATTMVCGTTMSAFAADGQKEADPDMAKAAKIVADCPVAQSGKYNVAPINDGNDSTGWLSEAFTTSKHKKHWVYVDLGTPKTFDQVKLVWDAAKYPEDYKIQVSETAHDSDWHDRKVVEGNSKGGEKTYDIETTTARYVRVYTTKNVTEDETIQLNTFSVFMNGEELAAQDAVAKDLETLTEDFIKTPNSLYEEIANKDLKNVKATLNLPKTGFASSDIEWAVTPNDGKINTDTGEVIRSEEDKDYKLTATVSKGDVSETKTFDVTVKANVVLGSEMIETEDRKYLELNGSPFLYVTVQNCGTQQLNGHAKAFKDMKPEDYKAIYGDADVMPLDYMENMFEKMNDLGYKHMGVIFKWRDWEPSEKGVYDWTIVDNYIRLCDKYDMSWDIVYFGSNSCGGTRLTNGNVGQDQWWMRNIPEWLDEHDGYWHNGDYVGVNHCPVLKGENYEMIKANEIRAIQDLMDHIATVDKNKRTATFQVMNEPDWHPAYRDGSGDKRWVQEWISDVAVAIKASDYSLVTRINGGYGMPHEDYVPISKLPGVDMSGDDAYTTSVSEIKNIFQNDLYDSGFPHIAENDGSFSNTSTLVLTTLLYGGGYHGWQFNDHSWDQGMADTGANGPYYTWKLGTPVKWRESGQDMSRLNPSMNKIAEKLACAPLDSMAGLNIETNNPSKTYAKVKLLDGTYVGYECNDASVALALKEGNDVYLVSDTASNGDGTVNFTSYQEILSASYVGYYKDEVGVADADKQWVDEVPVEVVRGEDGLYRVPVKAGQALKVTFGDSKLTTVQTLTTSEGDLTPEFNPDTHEYTIGVGADTSSIAVNAVLSNENAQYEVNGKTFTSGMDSQKVKLQFGENEIKVKVIWDGFNIDTEDNVYTIKVNRSEMNFNGGVYENVALKKKVSSPNYTGGWWHSIKNATNGNTGDYTQPASPTPVWNLKVDLDGAYAVDHIKLFTYEANIPTKFNVKVSEDGENWKTVLTEENFKGGLYDQSFAPANASYVLVEVLEAKTGNDCGWTLGEIEVYGVKGGSASGLTAEQVASSILSAPAYDNSGKITYPKVPSEFTVSVEKSSNEDIIALDGTVTPGKYDETVLLQFKVTNNSDETDVAYSMTVPVVIKANGTTIQNMNLALNKKVTGTASGAASGPFEMLVDGNRGTRYLASVGGYPQSVTVDLGSIMDINQVVTSWDAARPSEYKIWTSNDNKNWEEQGTYALDREGTVFNDLDTVSCRYVKLEATKRGPNTNQLAIMELEVYNKIMLSDDFVLQNLTLSEGEMTPAFDKYVNDYSVTVGNEVESIVVTTEQNGADAYTMINGKKVMNGNASEPIVLEVGKNIISVVVQDPDNQAAKEEYQIVVKRKAFSIEEYTNVALKKAVTTPGFDVGYWHELAQINDGDMGTFAQSSSNAVLDYQFDLGGYFTVDELEMHTGAANRTTSFEVKTSLDGKNWTTVLTVDNFDPFAPNFVFEPVCAKYILVDNKTSDGGCIAVNEIVVNGIPAEVSSEDVVATLPEKMEIAANETSVTLPEVPEGYTVSIKDSSNQDVIASDGTVTHTDKFETVELTVEVANGDDVAEKVITVTVQPETLTNQEVLDMILSQMKNPEKEQTRMVLPEAPKGFTVTYRDDQDGSNAIDFNGNIMTIKPGLSSFSLPIGVRVSGEEGAEAVDAWRPTFFPARSKTAQEVLGEVKVTIDGNKVVLAGAEEGYTAEIFATGNTNIIDAAGNVIAPDTTTSVDVYVMVTKEADGTTAMKVFPLSVEGKVDKAAIQEVIAQANELLKDADKYTEETVDALRDALETAEAYAADKTITQKAIDDAKDALQKAIDSLVEGEDWTDIGEALRKGELKNLIKDAEAIKADGYTEDSYNALQKAIADAKAVCDTATKQKELDEAVKELKKAIKALVKTTDWTEIGDAEKPEKGEEPNDGAVNTGDMTSTVVPVIVLIASLAVILAAGIVVIRRKRR